MLSQTPCILSQNCAYFMTIFCGTNCTVYIVRCTVLNPASTALCLICQERLMLPFVSSGWLIPNQHRNVGFKVGSSVRCSHFHVHISSMMSGDECCVLTLSRWTRSCLMGCGRCCECWLGRHLRTSTLLSRESLTVHWMKTVKLSLLLATERTTVQHSRRPTSALLWYFVVFLVEFQHFLRVVEHLMHWSTVLSSNTLQK